MVAVGIADGEDQVPADAAIGADRLAGAIADEFQFRRLHKHGLTARHDKGLEAVGERLGMQRRCVH